MCYGTQLMWRMEHFGYRQDEMNEKIIELTPKLWRVKKNTENTIAKVLLLKIQQTEQVQHNQLNLQEHK